MTLRHLTLRDFVIVPALELDLGEGFSALTGETGAGKSILVDAVQLVLGARGEALWVREGQPRCEIGAEFDTPAPALPWLEANGFAGDADTLLLRRSIDATGRSRAWINGAPATLAQLRELADWLVDIHGQHAWQSLTRPAAVRALLDAYAGADHAPLTQAWQRWQQAEAALQQAQAAQERLAQERERLLWQIGELDKLAPAEGEWDDLNQSHTRLSHAQALIDAAQAAAAALEAEDEAAGALPALAQAQHALQTECAIEPEFAALIEVLEASAAQARDAVHSLHAYLRRADPDPEQLATLDARMGQWVGLARRYRRPPEELPALLAGWREELARLESAADLERLQGEVRQHRASYIEAAQQVSALRASAAPRLGSAVSAAMQELGMAGGRFEVALPRLAEPAAHGLEGVVFLVAAHTGATPRPIDKVASGGELSRLALAIAVTTAQAADDGAATLIFDEIDAGIGGAVGDTVGALMKQLGHAAGGRRQVLAVTHLAQVAACADHHYVVSKALGPDGATTSTVAPVVGEARVAEVARMLGGDRLGSTSLAHAQAMLQQAMPSAPVATSAATSATTPAGQPRRRSKA